MTLEVSSLVSRRIVSTIRNFRLLSASRLVRRIPMAFSDAVSSDSTDGSSLPAAVAVFRQALVTFPPSKDFTAQLEKLRGMMSQLKAEDLGLDPIFSDSSLWKSPRKPPCTYIEVFQNQDINMSIFVLGPGYKMPLHDHPDMHGLLKVVSGAVNIRSYTEQPVNGESQDREGQSTSVAERTSNSAHKRRKFLAKITATLTCGLHNLGTYKKRIYRVKKFELIGTQMLGPFKEDNGTKKLNGLKIIAEVNPPVLCDENMETCVLTPTTSNYHEIEALGAPAAFIDILAPPYDAVQEAAGRRRCHYYKVLSEVGPNTVEMQEMDVPDEFYCDQAPYLGPLLS